MTEELRDSVTMCNCEKGKTVRSNICPCEICVRCEKIIHMCSQCKMRTVTNRKMFLWCYTCDDWTPVKLEKGVGKQSTEIKCENCDYSMGWIESKHEKFLRETDGVMIDI